MTDKRLRPLDGRTRLAKRAKQLEQAFTTELGGDLSDARLAAVKRASDLLAIAWQVRERFMAQDPAITITDVIRIEGTARRALVDLDLPASSGVRPAESLEQYLARTSSDGDDEVVDEINDDTGSRPADFEAAS